MISGSIPDCAHEIIFATGTHCFIVVLRFEQRTKAEAPSLRPII